MRSLISLLIVILLLLAPLPRAHAQGDVIGYLLSRINEERAKFGLNPLSINGQLTAAAQGHANYLASTVYIHPHRQRNGSLPQDRAVAAGYVGRVSENVVGGQQATPEWAFSWWLQSGIHHNNMLSSWTEVGIAYADGGQYGRWYTTLFGHPDREPHANEGFTGGNPPGIQASGPTSPPRPVASPRPTNTPTMTYTPSITYTPRATFTPTDTPTQRPPTMTPIVVEIAIEPSTTNTPTNTPTGAPTHTATHTATAQPTAVAIVPTAAPEPPPPDSGVSFRDLIPILLVGQALVIGGLFAGAILRRRTR